jgi:hypothetical protein
MSIVERRVDKTKRFEVVRSIIKLVVASVLFVGLGQALSAQDAKEKAPSNCESDQRISRAGCSDETRAYEAAYLPRSRDSVVGMNHLNRFITKKTSRYKFFSIYIKQ